MKRSLYIFRGKTPTEWSETNALGPFTSEAKARKAIREDLEDSMDGCETLSPGADADWAEQYHIMEIVKSFQPVVTAKVSVSLLLLAEQADEPMDSYYIPPWQKPNGYCATQWDC